jgi:hypothetical protein
MFVLLSFWHIGSAGVSGVACVSTLKHSQDEYSFTHTCLQHAPMFEYGFRTRNGRFPGTEPPRYNVPMVLVWYSLEERKYPDVFGDARCLGCI